MDFEYDPKKSLSNKEKHGVDFEEVKKLWNGSHVIIPAKNVEDENRFAILGKIKGKLFIGIYTLREEAIRIISCHRADKKWEKIYENFTKNSLH